MTDPITVRDAHVSDIPALAAIIRTTGLFRPDEADGFVASLADQVDGRDGGRRWLIAGAGDGAALLGPEPAPGVWNLLFLAVRPERRRRGIARALIGEAESRLREQRARLLLIDTSSEPPMAGARALYAALGYAPVPQIPDYWGPGDAKLSFCRPL